MSKWPEWVWVGLTARNFCKKIFFIDENKKDLIEWIQSTFHPILANKVIDVMEDEIQDFLGDWITNSNTTLKMQADLWNKTMKELGYTEEYKE